MARTIIVCGHGPGISNSVALKFGQEGFSVAIVARNAERLSASAAALGQAGVTCKAFPCDLGDPEAVRGMVREVASSLGPVNVLHWNAYGHGAGDLTTATREELQAVFDVSIHGMIAAVQESLADLKSQQGAVLVTGGGLAFYDSNVEKMAVSWGAMGLALAKAAQHKTAGLLHQKLAGEGVYVGEVVVTGVVKGTAFDSGGGTIEPSAVANKFWEMYQNRGPVSAKI